MRTLSQTVQLGIQPDICPLLVRLRGFVIVVQSNVPSNGFGKGPPAGQVWEQRRPFKVLVGQKKSTPNSLLFLAGGRWPTNHKVANTRPSSAPILGQHPLPQRRVDSRQRAGRSWTYRRIRRWLSAGRVNRSSPTSRDHPRLFGRDLGNFAALARYPTLLLRCLGFQPIRWRQRYCEPSILCGH